MRNQIVDRGNLMGHCDSDGEGARPNTAPPHPPRCLSHGLSYMSHKINQCGESICSLIPRTNFMFAHPRPPPQYPTRLCTCPSAGVAMPSLTAGPPYRSSLADATACLPTLVRGTRSLPAPPPLRSHVPPICLLDITTTSPTLYRTPRLSPSPRQSTQSGA